MKGLLEICCGSFEDVKCAWENGANRVELNSALYLGGLTPSLAHLICAKEQCDISVVTMVRPRGGGFCYSEEEYRTMLLDARILLEHGADGIAFGFLHADHTLDVTRTKEMIALVHEKGKEAVFHRAFDCVAQQENAVETLISLGADRILTSGGAPDVWTGRKQLQWLQSQYGKEITFLAGSGVNAENVKDLMEYTKVEQVHTSCRKWNVDGTTSYQNVDFSYDAEKIRELSCKEAKNTKEEGLYTLLLCNENVQKRRLVPGMSDESFLRVVEGEKTVPMTKEEVRALSLCKLGLTEDAVVYDVGSGTGSIAVECAKCSPGIRVYAIEQKATAQQLLRRNLEKFHLANVIPVDGKAPEILESLEPPTHVFIGGSSGRLADILHVIWEKNPRTRVVVNAISLETVAQITELAAGKMQTEIIQVQVSRAKTVGTYHLMQAENPVYICVLTMA